MQRSTDIRDLLSHAEWSDSVLWKTVVASREAATDAKVLGWLHHIHTVQQAFLALWLGREVKWVELAEFSDAEALAQWGRKGHSAMETFLSRADDPQLDRVLEIPWSSHFEARWGRPMAPVSLDQSIVQVAMHSAHHRGQVAARLRRLEVEPPLFDYIAWLWFGRPAPEWSNVSNPEA